MRETTGLEPSEYATTKESDNTPLTPLMEILEHNCNHWHAICLVVFKDLKKDGADMVGLQKPYISGGMLAYPAY